MRSEKPPKKTRNEAFASVLLALALLYAAPARAAEYEATDAFSLDSYSEVLSGIDGLTPKQSPACTPPETVPNAGLSPACPIRAGKDVDRCRKFIAEDCSLGPTGEFIASLFGKPFTPRSRVGVKTPDPLPKIGDFIDHPPTDIRRVCPGYDRPTPWSRELKEEFWVFTVMQIAAQESDCANPNTRSSATSEGPLQVDRKESANNTLRPLECSSRFIAQTYGKNASRRDLKPNLHCGLAALTVQMAKPSSLAAESRSDLAILSGGKLFYRYSQWGTLRLNLDAGQSDEVKKAIGQFGACARR